MSDPDNNRHEGRTVRISVVHDNCVNCNHTIARVPMTFEFTVAAPTIDQLPDSNEIVDGLYDALPREWFTVAGADWWLSSIDRT